MRRARRTAEQGKRLGGGGWPVGLATILFEDAAVGLDVVVPGLRHRAAEAWAAGAPPGATACARSIACARVIARAPVAAMSSLLAPYISPFILRHKIELYELSISSIIP